MCPLNRIEITGFTRAQKLGDNFYKMGFRDQYLTPIYGSSSNNSAIVNIEIINNYKVCLEKHNNKELPCEFPDNNECFIEDNYEEVPTMDDEENYKLYASNLAKWNLLKNDNINHDFCKKDLRFHILVHGYINFTDNNLKEFEEEFPPGDFTNNSLYKTYEAYKSMFDIRENPEEFDEFKANVIDYFNKYSVNREVLEAELPFEIDRGNYILNGAIDLIYKTGDNEIVILDYKYAEYDKEHIDSYTKQLHLYAAALNEMPEFKDYKIKKAITHFVLGDYQHVVEITDEKMTNELNGLDNVASEIELEKYPSIVSDDCEKCSYRIVCKK